MSILGAYSCTVLKTFVSLHGIVEDSTSKRLMFETDSLFATVVRIKFVKIRIGAVNELSTFKGIKIVFYGESVPGDIRETSRKVLSRQKIPFTEMLVCPSNYIYAAEIKLSETTESIFEASVDIPTSNTRVIGVSLYR